MIEFIKQGMNESVDFQQSLGQLQGLLAEASSLSEGSGVTEAAAVLHQPGINQAGAAET